MKNQDNFFNYVYEYLTCRDEDYLIRPQLFYRILFVAMLSCIIYQCTGTETNTEEPKKVNHIIMEDAVQVGDSIEVNWHDGDSLVISISDDDKKEALKLIDSFYVPKSRYWSSKEVDLPIGIVTRLDHSHGDGGKIKNDYSNNYVTVKTPSGKLVITRDVELDLYLNLQEGDTIK